MHIFIIPYLFFAFSITFSFIAFYSTYKGVTDNSQQKNIEKSRSKIWWFRKICVPLHSQFRNNTIANALVAQLVEHLTLNQRVQGSSPCRRTKREVPYRTSLFFAQSAVLQSINSFIFSISFTSIAFKNASHFWCTAFFSHFVKHQSLLM